MSTIVQYFRGKIEASAAQPAPGAPGDPTTHTLVRAALQANMESPAEREKKWEQRLEGVRAAAKAV
jgi:hypothetical protein